MRAARFSAFTLAVFLELSNDFFIGVVAPQEEK